MFYYPREVEGKGYVALLILKTAVAFLLAVFLGTRLVG